jgi:hypothetical protein
MWRANEDIMVQPTVGRAMHFASAAGALDSLIPSCRRSGQSRERRADGHRWVNPPHLLHSN